MDVSVRAENLRYQALLQLLRTADTIWTTSRAFFERWEISPSQFNVLNLLEPAPGGLSQTQLSRELITHRSNVTGLVDRLEKRGLVRRREVAADRRAYRVVLTEKGRTLLESILPDYHRGAESVWEGIPSQRLNELMADLQRAKRNVETLKPVNRPKVRVKPRAPTDDLTGQ